MSVCTNEHMITLTQNYQICHINIKNIYMQYMLLLCPLCTGTLTRKSSTIITLLPSPLQKSVKLSGCWIEMGMALYPSRSWAWRCARWDICPVRWSWRLSCNASTWTVSTHFVLLCYQHRVAFPVRCSPCVGLRELMVTKERLGWMLG